jgi:FK506-binding nuclear protein
VHPQPRERKTVERKLCILHANTPQHYQQPLDITVREGEEVYLCVTGTHDIYVTGNYIAFPDEDSEDEDEDDGLEQLGYDLGSDEDELDIDEMGESESDDLDDMEDPRITEVESEDEAPKLVTAGKKANKKRAAESEEDITLDDLISKTNGDDKVSKKAAKKLKKNDGQAVAGAAEPAKKADKAAEASDKKKVQFAKNLELGPTGSPLGKVEAPKAEAKKEAAKGPRNVSGVTVDDKREGKGKAAKKGDRVEMRYIGKLKNGKVFDCECLLFFLHQLVLTTPSQQEGQAILLQARCRPGHQGLGRRCRRHDPRRRTSSYHPRRARIRQEGCAPGYSPQL